MLKLKTTAMMAVLTLAMAIPGTVFAQSSIQEVAADLLGKQFGIPVREILQMSQRSQRDVFDLAPTFSTARHTGRSANDVMRLRDQGLGWGEIAHRLGMHPGTFNKLRKEGAFDRDSLWGSMLKNRYGVRDADLDAVRKRGGSSHDLLPACIISKAKHISPVSAYDRYRKDGDWNRTAKSYSVDLHREGMKHASKSKAAPAKAKDKGGEKSNGKSKSKSKGKGNGKGGGRG